MNTPTPENAMGTILVTGAAGYIGSHAAAALLKAGRKVVVLDDLSTGSRECVPEGAHFVQGDIGDEHLVESLFDLHDITAIMHFAGFVRVDESVREPEKYFRNNTEKARVLMEVACRTGIRHFIFSSTAAVYGNPAIVPVPENAPLAPLSPYGESKLRTENILQKMWTGDQNYTILRYFNVAGADPEGRFGYRVEEHPTHLIRRALAVARKASDSLPIYGTDWPTPDGTAVRDYIHVVDLVDAHLEALRHLELGGNSGIYNVGYGRGYSVLDVHRVACEVTGEQIPVREEKRREGDPASVVADSSRIRQELGWKPKRNDLRVMIGDQWKWEQAHQKLLEPR